MQEKLVSIIIPNYNGGQFIKDLFSSLSQQTFKNFEVIFVDNASTDNSIELLEEILKRNRYNNLVTKIIVNEENLGYCKGNNLGLEYANGEYVVFLNNDTYLSQTWLEKLVNVIDRSPAIAACQSRIICALDGSVQSDGRLLDVYGWSAPCIRRCESNGEVSQDLSYLSGASMIIRRSALRKCEGFDPELFFGDYDLCWRLRLLGYTLATSSNSICYHHGSVAIRSLMTDVNLALYNYRERLRVLLKIYSFTRLLQRIPLCLFLMLIESVYFTFRSKVVSYLVSLVKAVVWNLKNLKDTLIVRHKTQYSRSVSDSDVEERMLSYPLLFFQAKTLLTEAMRFDARAQNQSDSSEYRRLRKHEIKN